MSNAAPEPATPTVPGWDRLELTVRRLMAEHEALQKRALAAEKRVGELEAALQDVKSGRLDPLAASERARALEEQNRVLSDRMGKAREMVERILGRIQFAEDDR